MKRIIALSLTVLFLAACSTSNNVASNKLFQKRKYKKGWHVNSSRNIDKTVKVEEEEIVYNSEIVEENQSDSQEIQDSQETTSNSNTSFAEETLLKEENSSLAQAMDENSSQPTEEKVEKNSTINSNIVEPIFNERSLPEDVKAIENKNNSSGSSPAVSLVVLVLLAIFIPPLAVFLARGLGDEFWISLILTLLFWLPGMIYALLIVLDVI